MASKKAKSTVPPPEKVDFDRRQFQKVFRNQKITRGSKQWTDDLFPPNELSLLGLKRKLEFTDSKEGANLAYLINPKNIEWKRAGDIIKEPMLFEGKIDFDALRLGEIANTYFLTAISGLSDYPNLINQIFLTKKTNDDCIYQLSLFIDGQFQIVFLDDYFPVIKGTDKLFFARSVTQDLWGMLLEKAWAKINGGYANIITGTATDVLRTLTGYSCEFLITREIPQDSMGPVLKKAFANKAIVCGATRGDTQNIKKLGLEPGCSYNLLYGNDVVNDTNKKIYLIKIRNAWGTTNWTGDYSEKSGLWTEDMLEQIGSNHLDKKGDTEFYMPVKDVWQCFDHLDICHPIFSAKTKFYDFRPNDLTAPHVFNILLKERSMISISALEKKWRFNRELKNVQHPTSMILGEYNPETSELKNIYSDFDCENDTEITREINPGYYILWVYKPYDFAQKPKPEFMRIKFACNHDVLINYVGADEEFLVISDIVAQNVRFRNRNKIKRDSSFYDIQNSLDKSGIAYRLVLNDSSDYFENWDVDATGIEGISLLPPHKGSKKFNFKVAPNSYLAILGIQNAQFGNVWFNLKSEASQVPFDPNKTKIKNPKADLKSIYTDKFNPSQSYDYVTSSYDTCTTSVRFPLSKRQQNLSEMQLKNNYSKLMRTLSGANPESVEMKNLVHAEVKRGDLSFIGETNSKTKSGRGIFHDSKTDMTLVTSWNDSDETVFGQIYNLANTVVYEGELVNGIFHGKGTYYLPTGEKYVGSFVNGCMEGNGIFYWNDGSRWEGTFTNNKLDGEGVFYNPKTKTSFNAIYKNNRLILDNLAGNSDDDD